MNAGPTRWRRPARWSQRTTWGRPKGSVRRSAVPEMPTSRSRPERAKAAIRTNGRLRRTLGVQRTSGRRTRRYPAGGCSYRVRAPRPRTRAVDDRALPRPACRPSCAAWTRSPPSRRSRRRPADRSRAHGRRGPSRQRASAPHRRRVERTAGRGPGRADDGARCAGERRRAARRGADPGARHRRARHPPGRPGVVPTCRAGHRRLRADLPPRLDAARRRRWCRDRPRAARYDGRERPRGGSGPSTDRRTPTGESWTATQPGTVRSARCS